MRILAHCLLCPLTRKTAAFQFLFRFIPRANLLFFELRLVSGDELELADTDLVGQLFRRHENGRSLLAPLLQRRRRRRRQREDVGVSVGLGGVGVAYVVADAQIQRLLHICVLIGSCRFINRVSWLNQRVFWYWYCEKRWFSLLLNINYFLSLSLHAIWIFISLLIQTWTMTIHVILFHR